MDGPAPNRRSAVGELAARMARYRIVPERSRVWIDGRSSLHEIHSGSNGLEGYVDLEVGPDGAVRADSEPAGSLSVPVRLLSTGNTFEDRELFKRVDLRRYPTIEGVMEHLGDSDGDGSFKVTGEITFRGVSRHYEHEMRIRPINNDTVELAGESRFDVRDFGMDPPRMLMLRVEPEVDIRVEIVAVKDEKG